MNLFDNTIREIDSFISSRQTQTLDKLVNFSWPSGKSSNIILHDDCALELGSPKTESVSALLFTDDISLVTDSRISLAGPDIRDLSGIIPYGRVAVVAVDGLSAENAYERYREMEDIRFRLDLKGYMLRAASQYMREWARISREAHKRGFGFSILASALINGFKILPYVKAVEMIFVTSSIKDVRELKTILEPAGKIIGAMNKMANEMDLECDECDYKDICSDAELLKGMRLSLKKTGDGR